MDNALEWLKNEAWSFVASKHFLSAMGVLFAYMFLTGIFRRTIDMLGSLIKWTVAVFGGLTIRKAFFSFLSLIFMVGGVASASGAHAKLNGKEGLLESIVGGGSALAVWGFVMLIATHLRFGLLERKQPRNIEEKK